MGRQTLTRTSDEEPFLADEDGHVYTAPKRLLRREKCSQWLPYSAALNIVLFLLLVFALALQRRNAGKAYIPNEVYSPAQSAVEYETVVFKGGLSGERSKYQGFGQDVDDRWDELHTNMLISQIDAESASKLPNKTTPFDKDHSHYIVELDVFHQLHCLNELRKLTYPLAYFALGLVSMGLIVALFQRFIISAPAHARILPHAAKGTDPDTGLPLAWSNGDCGNSPEDAKALGCQYSIVLHSWLPKSCLTEADEEDAKAMYKDRINWPYETQAGKNLTMLELALGDYHHFTTTFEWHVVHCMYVWKRLHRILLDPSQELDSYTANYHHTSHCVKMIGGHPEGMKDSGTRIFVKYPKCAK